MRSLEIRPATRADVLAMSAMQTASLVETYEPFLGRAAVEEFMAGGSVERYFEERWEQCTVATLGGEIVGVAVRQHALLDLVWVKPSSRSKGIGSLLMGVVEDKAALEANELRLEVWTVNEWAVRFYERRGFSVEEAMTDPATGLEKLLLQKTL